MKRQLLPKVWLFNLSVVLPIAAATPPESSNTEVAPPPLPSIRTLKLEPDTLTLKHGRDGRRILVWGETEGGKRFDLTAQAILKSSSPSVSVDVDGYIRPKNKGVAKVIVSAAGKQADLKITIEDATMPAVRFVRDVEPILSKAGCNAGTCHGSAKGKNGFKLSLRGYDPEFDYQALINDLSGRRFNRVVVEESLVLLKPLGEVPHEGRQAIKPDSPEYHLLRQWIAEGAKFEEAASARVQSIEIVPQEVEIDLPGRTQQILVMARYADGSARDVTRDAFFSSSNTDVAEVKEGGLVKSLRRGEAAVLVRYEGQYGAKLVTVMGDRTGYAWVDVPEHNYIDKHIHSKLQKMKILPSDLCTDAEFMRRVYFDLTGIPPKPDKVRAFLADTTFRKEKREKLIDELIGSPDYIEFWANKWADLLQCNSENLGEKAVWLYRDWIRQNIARNTPYDQFVRAVLTAQGSCYDNPAANYFRVLREPGRIVEDVSQTFLGVRFNCNKCHDHPFERWTQTQYYESAAYFAQVGIKKGYTDRKVIFAEAGGSAQVTAEEVVYRKYDGGDVKHLKTEQVMKPKVPVGQTKDVSADGDRRDAYVDWLTSKDNPYFAKSAANRIWSYFLGKGIIDPVDDIRASNPPSNPELLDALTDEFVRSGFDLRKLMRTICQSRTYQLSIVRNKWNEDDTINFSHATPRRLSAEQLADAMAVATGTKLKFEGIPAGMRAVQIPDGMTKGNEFLSLFGRPKRQSACECERSSNLTLSHALSMINGNTISEAVNSTSNRLAKLVETEKDNNKLVEDIYLSCLSRPPTEKELAAVKFDAEANRMEVAQDLVWALLNSPAFLFNR